MNSKRYGMVGWQEFASNRTQILAKYDLSKAHEASRPTKTAHGVAGEAAIREWLSSFLPTRYAVTSGYIIPDVVQTPGYKLYHYDIIIFDALNAPILWTEGNPDQSELGKRRAIPAKYVHSVLEVKSRFAGESASSALEKLRELNAISSHFPVQFSSAIIFVELPESLVSNGEALRHLIPEPPVFGLWGGLILSCGLNKDMSGELSFFKNDGGVGSVQNAPDVPLAKDIDKLDIYINHEGSCVIAESGGGAMFVSDGVSTWMVSKQYAPTYCSTDVCVMLSWSANGFSQFALDLLNRLEGKGPREENYRFGQIFDFLERR